MKDGKKSKGLFADVALIIVCLAVAASCLASGMFAKYVSTAGAEKQKARAASFNVSATLDNNQYTVNVKDSENTGKYAIELKNDSETAVSYTVTLTFKDDVSSFITAKLDGKEVETEDGKAFIWKNAGTLGAGESGTAELELIIGEYLSGTADYVFNINVTFTQVD